MYEADMSSESPCAVARWVARREKAKGRGNCAESTHTYERVRQTGAGRFPRRKEQGGRMRFCASDEASSLLRLIVGVLLVIRTRWSWGFWWPPGDASAPPCERRTRRPKRQCRRAFWSRRGRAGNIFIELACVSQTLYGCCVIRTAPSVDASSIPTNEPTQTAARCTVGGPPRYAPTGIAGSVERSGMLPGRVGRDRKRLGQAQH
ncbi:hypothetical protein C8Q78DRAFT_1037658 [Trametes maxima]|nr:hypothetical protein C8Q78DRAFT_1037658 [Trametes maxima]